MERFIRVDPITSMKNTSILLAAALMVGVAGGYLAGRNTSGGDSTDSSVGDVRELRSRVGERDERGSTLADRGSRKRATASGYDEINRMPGSSDRIEAMMNFYKQLTVDQLEQEARRLDDLPMSERMMASLLLFSRWGEVDPYSAIEHAKTMGFAGMFVRPTVLKSWASVDPVNAAYYYKQNPREFANMGGGRGGFMGGQEGASIIAGEWAKQDPTAALEWASSLTTEKGQAISGVLGEVAKSDPVKAAEMLKGVDAAEAGSAYRAVAEEYGASNFAQAKAWIQSLPADEQAGAMAAAISGLARTDPSAAAAQTAQMASGDPKDRAVRSVVDTMARDNPQQAADFLAQNGSAQAQEQSMRDLIPAWVNQDPAGALNYTNTLPEGDVRDRALRSYVWSNSSENPATLVQVAETITNDRDRSRTVGWMVSRWMREDEAAAKAYVQQTSVISDRMKEHILGEH